MTADRRASSTIAATDELCVDHLVPNVDIAEQPPNPVPLLNVEFQPDLVTIHELTGHLGGFPPARLGSFVGCWVSGGPINASAARGPGVARPIMPALSFPRPPEPARGARRPRRRRA